MIEYKIRDESNERVGDSFVILQEEDLTDKMLFKRFRGKKPNLLWLPKRKLWNFLSHKNLKEAFGSFLVGGVISKTDLKTYVDVSEIDTTGYDKVYHNPKY